MVKYILKGGTHYPPFRTKTAYSLDAKPVYPALSDIVFFSSDYSSMGSRLTFPGGCGGLTLGHFKKFKMAAKMAAKLRIPI